MPLVECLGDLDAQDRPCIVVTRYSATVRVVITKRVEQRLLHVLRGHLRRNDVGPVGRMSGVDVGEQRKCVFGSTP